MHKASLTLTLQGKARLRNGTATVPLRRKALALLYYLALEGPTTRDQAADLLWGHAHAANNLRVELSYLRQFLDRQSLAGLASGRDPLELPESISLAVLETAAHMPASLLQGLDDVSPEYQEWLERKRTELQRTERQMASSLVNELAAVIQPPFVVIIQPQFGASARSTAQQLAARLRLDYREGIDAQEPTGSKPALRFVPSPCTDETAAAILAAANTVFVLEKSGIAESPLPLLRLRSHYPAERTRYVKLPPLSWAAAQPQLQELPFEQAASAFLASTGNPGYLQELAAMRQQLPALTTQQLPRRIEAQVRLKTSRLSPEALLSLERCSVHPGVLPDRLLQVLQAEASAEELERARWLQFHPDLHGWTISNQLAQQVIYQALQPGRRRHYHQLAASCFDAHDQPLPALYHRLQATGTVRPDSRAITGLSGWARSSLDAWLNKPAAEPAPQERRLLAGEELLLLPAADYTDQQPGVIVIERWLHAPEQFFSWDLPDEPFLLRLRGRGLVHNALGVGLSGRAAPLQLSWTRIQDRVTLGHALNPVASSDTELLLPFDSRFEYWLRVPGGGQMLLSSRAETALIKFEVSAYRYRETAPGADPGQNAVPAIMLGAHANAVTPRISLVPAF